MKRNRLAIPGGFADHLAVVANARRTPGTWVMVSVYRGFASAQSTARNAVAGHCAAYRPARSFEAYAAMCDDGWAVWARYVDGVADLVPLPESLTVRVPSHGTQRGYEGVSIRTVDISSRCQRCGGPRGEVRQHTYVHDGELLTCDAWLNTCGHTDMYEAVLAEALHREEVRNRVPAGIGLHRKRPVLRGVEGGMYREAVDALGAAIQETPALTASAAEVLLEDLGHMQAVEELRVFVADSPVGGNTSARAVGLYLNQRDKYGLAGLGEWVDGPIGCGDETTGGDQ